MIMHHIMGEHAGAGGWGFVRGGMGTISQAIASAGREKGMQIRTGTEVIAIDDNGRATGDWPMAAGSLAPIVASNVSAKLTFLKFLKPEVLPESLLRDIRTFRTYSAAFKVNIACERLPVYPSFDAATCGFAYQTYTHIRPHN